MYKNCQSESSTIVEVRNLYPLQFKCVEKFFTALLWFSSYIEITVPPRYFKRTTINNKKGGTMKNVNKIQKFIMKKNVYCGIDVHLE